MAEVVRVGMSLEEFESRFAMQPFEIINGEIRDMAPTKRFHREISRHIFGELFLCHHRHSTIEIFYETTYILEDVSAWVKGSRV